MPPPVPPLQGLDTTDSSTDEHNSDGLISSYYTDSDTTEDPILFSQKHLNDLIRDLCFSKEKAELLASRLKEQNMVEKDVKVSYSDPSLYRASPIAASQNFLQCFFYSESWLAQGLYCCLEVKKVDIGFSLDKCQQFSFLYILPNF